ncbi:MAG: M23 family metallopeptidase [Bacteroidetes bacterium]|nr:M23 family metallopeptidase [Bacteroidota bacterium]
MSLKFKIAVIILVFLHLHGGSQTYAWPVDSPRVITGNYGEIRPGHFHTGLDFSTNGKINYAVYSIEEGYVSRIKVSSVGYGRSVYVTHKDGKVSVYGHLNSFNSNIAPVVKNEQYAKRNYEIEIFPKPFSIKVKKHEYVGLSGNSGASTGPHLHFEIRDGQTEVPLNPLEYFSIQDTVDPTITEVGFYNLADTSSPHYLASYKVELKKNKTYAVKKDSVILNQGILGFAFSGFDQFTPKGNTNNIFSAKVYFDDRLIYSHTLDNIDFADQRFVNEFSELVEKTKTEKVLFQKCFVPTLHPLNFYDQYKNKGRILLTDTNFHKLKLSAIDENANERVIEFYFKTRKLNYYGKPSINSDVYVDCRKDFMIAKKKLQIYIPANTFYYSTGLIFENTIESTGKIIILPTDANLRTTSIIGFEVPPKYMRNKSKLVLKSGSNVLPPIVNHDSVFYSVKNLGWFLLDQDTIAPQIKTQMTQLLFKKNKKTESVSFRVTDELSGIKKYNLFLNDKWVIGEYDAKNDLITYFFDEDSPKTGDLNFKLEAEDRVGNKNDFFRTLKR